MSLPRLKPRKSLALTVVPYDTLPLSVSTSSEVRFKVAVRGSNLSICSLKVSGDPLLFVNPIQEHQVDLLSGESQSLEFCLKPLKASESSTWISVLCQSEGLVQAGGFELSIK